MTPRANSFAALVVLPIEGKSALGLEALVVSPDGVGAGCDGGEGVGVTLVGTLAGI